MSVQWLGDSLKLGEPLAQDVGIGYHDLIIVVVEQLDSVSVLGRTVRPAARTAQVRFGQVVFQWPGIALGR